MGTDERTESEKAAYREQLGKDVHNGFNAGLKAAQEGRPCVPESGLWSNTPRQAVWAAAADLAFNLEKARLAAAPKLGMTAQDAERAMLEKKATPDNGLTALKELVDVLADTVDNLAGRMADVEAGLALVAPEAPKPKRKYTKKAARWAKTGEAA